MDLLEEVLEYSELEEGRVQRQDTLDHYALVLVIHVMSLITHVSYKLSIERLHKGLQLFAKLLVPDPDHILPLEPPIGEPLERLGDTSEERVTGLITEPKLIAIQPHILQQGKH